MRSRPLGRTGLEVSALRFGASPLGGRPENQSPGRRPGNQAPGGRPENEPPRGRP
ncbi:hypothetical protein [Actinoallomurus rhizosphaericola]|uniref:hypothetical protein n=1 Tax=Actinoallomurus rhizosphaericola TaxID=2952536 RepID=UPI002092F55A|nr:hypothetical protein [Actinoallomurus rhizosphaericola]MCO5995641.1 hypothetical protein [Actinoallomurus rhizosphaericola]